MSATLFRIIAPHFTAGITLQCRVIRAAPILRYMMGWEEWRVTEYCRRKKWLIESFPCPNAR